MLRFPLIPCGFVDIPQPARSIGYGSVIEIPRHIQVEYSMTNQTVLRNKNRHIISK